MLIFGCLLVSFIHGEEWRSMISQVDTGRVYMYRFRLGCGTEKFLHLISFMKFIAGTLIDHQVCRDNGHKSAEFFGNFVDYEKFLNRKFKRHTKRGNRRDIRKYLLHVHRHHHHADIPDFTVGGGKVKKRGKRESDDYFARWQLIDYSVYGGNCVKETSSVFVHCRTSKQRAEQATNSSASWSEWTGFDEDYCHCGQQIQSSRYCQNERNSGVTHFLSKARLM